MKIIPTAYFGNIYYFSTLLSESKPLIELYENYNKQTYRNRCDILAANGVISLIVPIVKRHNEKILVKDVEIDYSMQWQRQHLRSIESAYRNAPYFEHYFELIEPIFAEKEPLLVNLNDKTIRVMCNILGLDPLYEYTQSYVDKEEIEGLDYREIISPKNLRLNVDKEFDSKPYYQVFSEKMDFQQNLSMLDLIFCEGPMAKMYINK